MTHKELTNIEGRYVQSTLDDDLYKLNMQFAAFQLFPRAKVQYKYILRSDVKFPKGFGAALRDIVQQYSGLTAPDGAEEFLNRKCGYLPPTFINFLMNFRFNPSEVGIIQHTDGSLEIDIEGYFFSAIRWEVTLMATISELYFLMTGKAEEIDIQRMNNSGEKASHLRLHAIYFAEFGTRRRFSFANQLHTVRELKRNGWDNFIGTSNVHIAMMEDLTPIGTQGHEWFMFHLAMYGARMANVMGMQNWADVFNGENGIVLPDTFTTNEFIKVFSKRMSKLYDGTRWDSGSFQEYTDKFVEHYKSMKIDHTAKSYVYSDGINSLDKCYEIVRYGHKTYNIPRQRLPLGIGTWFTNDFEGVTPLNQVIKMWAAQPIEDGRWVNVCKVSDSFGKITGDEEEASLTMRTLGVKIEDLQKTEEEAETTSV